MSEFTPEVANETPKNTEGRIEDQHKAELMAYNEDSIRNGFAVEQAKGQQLAQTGNPDQLEPVPDNMYTRAAHASARIMQEMPAAIERGAKETADGYDAAKLHIDQVRERATTDGSDTPYQAELRTSMEGHIAKAMENVGMTGEKRFSGATGGRNLANDVEFQIARGQAHRLGDTPRTAEEYTALNQKQHDERQALQEKQEVGIAKAA